MSTPTKRAWRLGTLTASPRFASQHSHGYSAKGKQKDEKEINKEISAIIRQIFSSVSFLPMLEGACEFATNAASVHACVLKAVCCVRVACGQARSICLSTRTPALKCP